MVFFCFYALDTSGIKRKPVDGDQIFYLIKHSIWSIILFDQTFYLS